jgi:hypothetical protein
MAAGAVVLLALATLIGAAIGFVLGAGAGAAPGAAIGFEVGLALIEWIGLGFLIQWIAHSVQRIGSAFATFFTSVWSAHGDHQKLELAALELAEAIGICAGVAIEALVMWAAAKGVDAALGALQGTALARAFGESLGPWLRERVGNFKEGKTEVPLPRGKKVKVPGPREALVLMRAPKLAKELGIPEGEAASLLRVADAATISGLKSELGEGGLKQLAGKPRAFREAFFEVLELVGADGVARAQLMEALRLNRKGTLANAVTQQALNAYLAFLKRHGKRVSGAFMKRFWRALAEDTAEALAELRLAEDLLAGKTPLGPIRNIEGLLESPIPTEQTPEFRVTLPSGSRLVECKTISNPGKPLAKEPVRRNVGEANGQLRDESFRTGEVDGLIRLDARDTGKTDMSAEQLNEWVSSKIPSPRESRATRWVELFYKNAQGEVIKVVLELKGSRFSVHSQSSVSPPGSNLLEGGVPELRIDPFVAPAPEDED